MRKVREVLRLKHVLKLTERQIERSVGISHGTVGAYLKRAEKAGLAWEEAEKLSDVEVEARLFRQVGRNEPAPRAPIDFGWVHTELRRVGATLELLWGEYLQAVAEGGSGRRPYLRLSTTYQQRIADARPHVRCEITGGCLTPPSISAEPEAGRCGDPRRVRCEISGGEPTPAAGDQVSGTTLATMTRTASWRSR